MDRRKPYLREVEPRVAIGHALWEAHVCIGRWAFCACLAMLRKALDIWTKEYRDTHGMIFNKKAKPPETDKLYWRLRKIAEENRLYSDAIGEIIDGLRLDANEALHDSAVCSGGQGGRYSGDEIQAIREPYQRLHGAVTNLLKTVYPDLRMAYSDPSGWAKKPPDAS